MKNPTLNPRFTIRAFSLIEIVLAVGIVSFALVGILGLFPVALEAAADSRQETQATFIAQQVFSGLSSPAPFLTDTSSKLGTKANLLTNQSTTLYFDDNGEQTPTSSGALYEARVAWTANAPSPGLTRVDLAIITPSGLPARAKPSSYPFVALLRQPPAPATPPTP
jgi:uncharacterized protein (TIGR02598 family)